MANARLGRTPFEVSPVGFGAFKIGRNVGIKYPSGYELPDDDAVERLLNGVLDLGINYIDTAPAYGVSEERIGRAISRRRSEFVLSTKVGETFTDGVSTYDFTAAATRASVERSLRRLNTDRLDIVFVHAPANDVEVLTGSDVVATLLELRDRGDIAAIGFSGKTVDAETLALEWADVLMVEYHIDDRSHEAVIAEARRQEIGVVVKKGLASGRLDAVAAIDFVLANPGVQSLVIGGLSLDHIQENVRIATDARSA